MFRLTFFIETIYYLCYAIRVYMIKDRRKRRHRDDTLLTAMIVVGALIIAVMMQPSKQQDALSALSGGGGGDLFATQKARGFVAVMQRITAVLQQSGLFWDWRLFTFLHIKNLPVRKTSRDILYERSFILRIARN